MINNVTPIGEMSKLIGKKDFSLVEGLNIFYASNGVGKSYLLKQIKEACFINIGGFDKHRKSFNFETYPQYLKEKNILINIDWDGAGVFYLDNKYFTDWHSNVGYEMSTGKRIPEFTSYMERSRKYLSSGQMSKSFFQEIYDLDLKPLSTLREESYIYKNWNNFIETMNGNHPTLILDEIDSNLDLNTQLWFHLEYLPELSKKFQVIIVSHSPYVYHHINNSNFIDLDGSFQSSILNLKNFLNK